MRSRGQRTTRSAERDDPAQHRRAGRRLRLQRGPADVHRQAAGAKKRLVEFGLEAHLKTIELIKAGKPAAAVVREYEAFVEARGFKENMLYGPCHGIGMMEVERPWMESSSTYDLQENMTFQVDTFFHGDDFGLRWENGVRIIKGGVEKFSEKFMRLVEL